MLKKDYQMNRFDKGVPRRISGIHITLNIVTVMKCRQMLLARHVAILGRLEINVEYFRKIPKGRHHETDQGVDEKIILKWM
jgi:hypothetical protein